jgi:hypothetical protein
VNVISFIGGRTVFTGGPWIWAQTLSVLPLFGVYVAAMVLAATNRRRAGRAPFLVFSAASVLLLTLVVQQVFFVTARLSNFLLNTGLSHEQIAWAFVGMGFVMSAFHAAGIFLLALAAFLDRDSRD